MCMSSNYSGRNKEYVCTSNPFLYARNSMLNMMLLVVIGVMYVWTFLRMPKIVTSRFLLLAFFVIMSFALTLIFFTENTTNIVNALPRSLPYCFITCFFLSTLSSFQWIEYYMKKFSIVIVFCSLISAVAIFRTGHITTSTWSSYSMPLSYVTMLAVMWLLYRYFEEEKARWVIMSLLGTGVIIAYGSRNPLLAIVTFIIISVLKKATGIDTKKKLFYITTVITISIALLFWKNLLSVLGDVLTNIGINSRTINLLLQDTISTSGRDTIHSELLIALNNHPFLGLGVLGDEVVLSDLSQSAHGLYLSILSNYGYFIGGIFILVCIYWCILAYKRGGESDKNILLIYMCMVWPRGFTGGDIWSSDVFWWMIGLVLAALSARFITTGEWREY